MNKIYTKYVISLIIIFYLAFYFAVYKLYYYIGEEKFYPKKRFNNLLWRPLF